MSNKLPRAVPLPEVGEHSEDIVFGNLGLPVGFDDERLLINLRAMERVRTIAGLGTVSIVGVAGEAGEMDYGVSGVNSDGSASLGGVMKRRKKPLSHANLTWPDNTRMIGKPDVAIEVNNAETTERIHEQGERFDRGVFEPEARAKYLNKAVRKGLISAAKDANVDRQKLIMTAAYTFPIAQVSLLNTMTGESNIDVLPLTAYLLALSYVIVPTVGAAVVGYLRPDISRGNYMDNLKAVRKSIIPGAALDRVLGVQAVAMTGRFVKARS